MGSSVSNIYDKIKEHGSLEEYLKSLETTSKPHQAMNFKTFFIEEHKTEVCIHRDRNDEGEDFVLITAFIPDKDMDDEFVEEEVSFSSETTLKRFIDDYSFESAQEFVKSRMPIKD